MKNQIDEVVKNYNKKRKQKFLFGVISVVLSCIVCALTIYFFSESAVTESVETTYSLKLVDNYYLSAKGVSSPEELENLRSLLKEKETAGTLAAYIAELEAKKTNATITAEEQKILTFATTTNWKDTLVETYINSSNQTVEKSKAWQTLDLLYVDTNNNPIQAGADIVLSIGTGAGDLPDDPYGFGIVPYASATDRETTRGKDLIAENQLGTLVASNQAKYIFDHVEIDLNGNGTWVKLNSPAKDTTLFWNIFCHFSSATTGTNSASYGWTYRDVNNTINMINPNTKYKLVYKLIRQGTETVSSEQLTTNPGITFKLFDYGPEINSNGFEMNDAFFFRDTFKEIKNMNKVSDEDGFTANHATVLKELDSDGYPIFNDKGQLASAGLNNKSLGYLWGSTKNPRNQAPVGVTAYQPTNTLLKLKNFDGVDYYYYSSSENAVDYNTDNNTFMLRTYKERCETLPTTYVDEVDPAKTSVPRYEFYPFNYKTTVAAPYTVNGYTYDFKREDVNYWFGMSMEFNFYMTKDGKIKSSDGTKEQPMVFNFSGDDDVWVFIDGVLVLDLGGTHGAVDGQINFANGEVTSKSNWNGITSNSSKTNIKKLFEGTSKYDTTEWDGNTFTINTLHNVKFFYLERGAAVSNNQVKFNMPILPPGELSVKKEIEGETGGISEKFEFTLYDTTSGTATPVSNIEYTIDGKEYTTDSKGKFTLNADETAKFKLVNTHKYYVEETNSGINYEHSNCTLNGIKGESIKKTDVFKVDYTSAHLAVFTNKRSTVDIVITKDVFDDDKEAEFDFKFILKDNIGNQVKPLYTPTAKEGYKVNATTGTITFNLKDDESVTIKGVPKTVTATLQEVTHDGYNVLIKEGKVILSEYDTYVFTVNNKRSILVQNIPDVRLPETGSSSELTMLLAGIVLMLSPFVYKYVYLRNRKG